MDGCLLFIIMLRICNVDDVVVDDDDDDDDDDSEDDKIMIE